MVLFKRPADDKGPVWVSALIGVFVALGGLLFGYDTGTISGVIAMKYWKEHFSTGYTDIDGNRGISANQAAVIVSLLSVGTCIGSLSSPLLGDRLGRRWGIIVSAWVFNFGVILQVASVTIPLLVAGRFFAGLGVGLLSALVPLYQSETAPKWLRGLIVGAYQLAITIGILLAAVVNNATHARNDTGSYRIPIGLQLAFSAILIIGMHFLPETPRYLIKRGDMNGAARSLARIRRQQPNSTAIMTELDEIRANYQYEMSLGSASISDCFREGMRGRMFTGMMLQMLQQFTGVNFIFYYGTQYFKNSGVHNEFLISMIPAAVNVISTIPAVFMFDKYGRRPLLLWGAVGMCICQFIVATLGTTTTGQTASGTITVLNLSAQKASIGFVCLFICCFAATWGPLAWVVTSELYPLKHRSQMLSISTATNWLFNWAIAFSTPYLVNYGPGNANLQSKIFYIWAVACLFCIVFVYFYIYETKGLSLEEIDEMYQDPDLKAKDSSKWTPKARFRDIPLTEVTYNKAATGSPPVSDSSPSAENAETVEAGDGRHGTPPVTGFPPSVDNSPKGRPSAVSLPEEGNTYPLASRSRSPPHSAPSSPIAVSPISAPSSRANA
ncbi:hypothetical protein B0T20DRAFT_491635 [Sordaria brevicollis]|uniref:Major facilitator superfamily (MFS) profile domain-containing protein n=1 Tax=Sordaria brevicollis TaxID=83679 RepID=A0AAE0NRE5_SORBR|nr:hypothetical protein B0T20DRAFT_491635 [Sordaria brevicollis]